MKRSIVGIFDPGTLDPGDLYRNVSQLWGYALIKSLCCDSQDLHLLTPLPSRHTWIFERLKEEHGFTGSYTIGECCENLVLAVYGRLSVNVTRMG